MLSGVSFYFFKESKKPDYKLLIGYYVKEDAKLFSHPITDKDDYRSILFLFINATSIERPDIIDKLPDASIAINDSKMGLGYLDADLWFDNDKIIIALGSKFSTYYEYKEINGEQGKSYIESLISKYKIN